MKQVNKTPDYCQAYAVSKSIKARKGESKKSGVLFLISIWKQMLAVK